MKRYYNINYALLAVLLMPVMLRSNFTKALLSSFMAPWAGLNTQFGEYTGTLSTRINAQTCYMQQVLNDNFDYFERRIRVLTAPIDTDSYLLWKEIQDKPMMIGKEDSEGFTPHLLSRDGLIGVNNTDFDVVLPIGYDLSPAQESNMRLLINQNKLSPKKYTITYG
jgi:hypothetical protein